MATLVSQTVSLLCTVYSEFTILLPLPFQDTQVAMVVSDMWPKEYPSILPHLQLLTWNGV